MDKLFDDIVIKIKQKLPKCNTKCYMLTKDEKMFMKTEIDNWNSLKEIDLIPMKGTNYLIPLSEKEIIDCDYNKCVDLIATIEVKKFNNALRERKHG